MSDYMQIALALARAWKGQTSPNPMVGAVVVKDGQVVGKGAHQKAGGAHAEVIALDEAGGKAVGSTLYVTLEPCSHHGKTPPCTERILASGVKKVVAAMVDPNPLVAGRGVARLREAGVEVEIGDGETEARRLNEVFIKYISTRTPFIVLKAAVSLDGKIATCTGDSKWISNEQAREKVHSLRHEVDAVMVGGGTAVSDNPRLDVRLPGKVRDPEKIIFTRRLLEPNRVRNMAAYQLSREKPLLMIGAEELASAESIRELRRMGVDLLLIPLTKSPNAESGQGRRMADSLKPLGENTHPITGSMDLHVLMQALGERKVTSLLVEGGSGVYTEFLRAGLVDRIYLFQAPILLGGDGVSWTQALGVERVADAQRLLSVQYTAYGDNVLIDGYLDPSGSMRQS